MQSDPIIIIITPPPPPGTNPIAADSTGTEYDKALDLIQVAKATGARVRILRDDMAHTLATPDE